MQSKIAMVVAGVVIAGIAGWLVAWNGPRLEVVNEWGGKHYLDTKRGHCKVDSFLKVEYSTA